jgi:putative endonuclease
MSAIVYILLCADGSYYVGITRASLDQRIAQHQAGTFGGYTARRRPVRLVFHQEFQRITDAIAAERQVKGWRAGEEGGADPRRLRSLAEARGDRSPALQYDRAPFDKLRVRKSLDGIDNDILTAES